MQINKKLSAAICVEIPLSLRAHCIIINICIVGDYYESQSLSCYDHLLSILKVIIEMLQMRITNVIRGYI